MGDVVMPRLSDTMEEGTILRWLARDGEQIHRGSELVEIETDKATMVYESDQEGILRTIAEEGHTLAVGELIATVGDTTELESQPSGSVEEGPAPGGPAGLTLDGRGDTRLAPQRQAAPPPSSGEPGERVKASPLAKRIARERGIDLRTLTGTGPGGRIVKVDVPSAGAPAEVAPGDGTGAQAGAPAEVARGDAAGAQAGAHAEVVRGDAAGAPAGAAESVAAAKGASTEVELTRTQQTIARRMAESKATIPHFALEADVDMEECVTLRRELGRVAGGSPEELLPTYNDMVVKACALALRAHPRANSSYRDGRIQLHSRVNVGIAVAREEEELQGGALIVPTIFDADRKALGEIARETRALAARVRDGSITPPELSGGTFTVSNLGMYGVRAFTAIINPPQAAILSVGAARPAAVVREGGISIRHTMALTLACDHRTLYGADAARFLAHVRELLENPAALTL